MPLVHMASLYPVQIEVRLRSSIRAFWMRGESDSYRDSCHSISIKTFLCSTEPFATLSTIIAFDANLRALDGIHRRRRIAKVGHSSDSSRTTTAVGYVDVDVTADVGVVDIPTAYAVIGIVDASD